MKAVVKDANILIDLATCGCLRAWFSTNIATLTTSLVWDEVEQSQQRDLVEPWIKSGRLQIVEFSSDELVDLVIFSGSLPRSLSLEDASVLQVAIREEALLLTGDGRLRRYAEEHTVPVSGMLWIFDWMIDHQTLTGKQAAAALEILIQQGTRLPRNECKLRISRWRKPH